MKIPIDTLDITPAPLGVYIHARGFTAPVTVIIDHNHTIVKLREGGTLGILDEDLSRKLTFAPDKLRELQAKGQTTL